MRIGAQIPKLDSTNQTGSAIRLAAPCHRHKPAGQQQAALKTNINDQTIRPLAEETAGFLTEQARNLSWSEDIFIISVLLAAMEMHHPETAQHQRRIAQLVNEISRQLGFGADLSLRLKHAALLHDSGKLIVPP